MGATVFAPILPPALRRLAVYLDEMYPPLPRLAASALLYFGFAHLVARVHQAPFEPVSLTAARGVWAAFGSMLMLRLMDELKDEEVDRALFAGRPLPSGRVRAGDIRGALALVIAAFVFAFAGTPAFASALAVVGFAWLMFRWFFVPQVMRPRLLLTLATHQPFVPLVLLHLALVAGCAWPRLELKAVAVAPVVVLYWSGFLGWEIARKIRAPEQEDAYVTYSRLFGARRAVALAAAVQATGVLAAAWLWKEYGLGPGLPLLALAGYAAAAGGYLRFLRRPRASTSALRPFAEAHLLATCVAGMFA